MGSSGILQQCWMVTKIRNAKLIDLATKKHPSPLRDTQHMDCYSADWVIHYFSEEKKAHGHQLRLTTLFADANVGILLIGFMLAPSSLLQEKLCFHPIDSFIYLFAWTVDE